MGLLGDRYGLVDALASTTVCQDTSKVFAYRVITHWVDAASDFDR